MKKKLKNLLLAVSGLLLVVFFVGCGKGEESKKAAEDTTIEFWTLSLQPTFDDYFEELIANFKKENAQIKVEWKDYPFDALQNKLLTAISSGKAPDVVNLNSEMVLQMGGQGALASINDLLTKDAINSFIPGIYESTQIDNNTLGIPWYSSTPLLFMEKEIIDQAGLDASVPPETMAEYISWAEQIKDKTGIAGFTVVPEAKLFAYEGIPIISEDGKKAVFNEPDGVKMIEKYKKLVATGVAPKELLDFEKQVQLMATKDVGMTIAGTSFINKLKSTAPDVYENLITLPTPLGATNSRISTTMFLSIPSESKNKEAAAKFAEYLSNAENQLEFAKQSNTLPSTKESLTDVYFTESSGSVEDDAKMNSAKSMNDAVEYSLKVANTNEITSVIGKALQNILINGYETQEELDKAADQVNQILAKD